MLGDSFDATRWWYQASTFGRRAKDDERSRAQRKRLTATHGRTLAIQQSEERLKTDRSRYDTHWTLSGCCMVCHCATRQAMRMCRSRCSTNSPQRHSTVEGGLASSSALKCLARLRDELDSDERSTTDEGAPSRGAGRCGTRHPTQVGVGCTVRD